MVITVAAKHFPTDSDIATELDAQFCLWHGLNHLQTPWDEIHKKGSFVAALVRALDGE